MAQNILIIDILNGERNGEQETHTLDLLLPSQEKIRDNKIVSILFNRNITFLIETIFN